MKNILTICLFVASTFSTNAQVTDSIFVAHNVKQYLYTNLPNGLMFTAKGKEVDYQQYIKSKLVFKGKPTLYITWSDSYCPPCLRIIDTVLNKNLQDKFNVVLINRDQAKDAEPPTDNQSLVNKLADAHPIYNDKVISLYDSHNMLQSIDDGNVPMLMWMDSDFNICGTVMGYQITVKQIEDILQQIDDKKIQATKIKYLDDKLHPSSISNATFTLTTESLNGVHTFYWNNTAAKENYYKLNFIKTSSGYFTYHESSNQITKAEELYDQNETIAVLKQTLSSLNNNGIKTLKAEILNEYWSSTNLKLKNFRILIGDDKNNVKLRFYIITKFDKDNRKKSTEDFLLIGKYIEAATSTKPKVEKHYPYYYQSYAYSYDKGVTIEFNDFNNDDFYFEIIVEKDSEGNLPTNNVAKGDGHIEFADPALKILQAVAFGTTYENVIDKMKTLKMESHSILQSDGTERLFFELQNEPRMEILYSQTKKLILIKIVTNMSSSGVTAVDELIKNKFNQKDNLFTEVRGHDFKKDSYPYTFTIFTLGVYMQKFFLFNPQFGTIDNFVNKKSQKDYFE